MSCPTCDHTMENVGITGNGGRVFHCPRCGTLCQAFGSPGGYERSDYVPKLVPRCRAFASDPLLPLLAVSGEVGKLWHRLGIAESINPPDRRTP